MLKKQENRFDHTVKVQHTQSSDEGLQSLPAENQYVQRQKRLKEKLAAFEQVVSHTSGPLRGATSYVVVHGNASSHRSSSNHDPRTGSQATRFVGTSHPASTFAS